MGLLDELLGGVLRGGLGQPMGRPASQTGGAMGGVLVALLPVVLSMLASRRGIAGAGGGPGASGGGGLGDLLDQFRQQGYGQQADSWVSRGTNLPISPDVVTQVFGKDRLAQIAAQAGVSREEAAAGLSQVLPEVVDHVTPDGQVPDLDALSGSVDALQRRLGR